MEAGTPPPDATLAAKNEEAQAQQALQEMGGTRINPEATSAERAEIVEKALPPGLTLSSPGKTEKTGLALSIDSKATLNGNGAANGKSPDTNGSLIPGAPKSPLPTSPNGMVNGFPKAGDGEWDRTGWAPRFGSLNDELGLVDAQSRDHQTFLDAHLSDNLFGDWYHNAGIIIFACVMTWFITKIGGGFAWIILVMATCGTYYRTSMMRVRRNVKDDLNREFAKQRLDSDVESLEWINSFIVKFWPIYCPVLEATIINIADPILAANTPGFLDSIRLPQFKLGTKPPRLDHVKTYPKTEDDIVEMDWKFSFTPNDTADLTSRQLKNKVNPKVELEIRVGQGLISKGIPIIVEDMTFSGLMKFKIKLQIPFPHIEKVDVCFLERPHVDFVLKPLGGDTFGFDIGFLPGLGGFIQDQIHSNLAPMFYAPNLFTVEIAKMLSGAPIDQAIGVLQVTIHHAQGLKNTDAFGGAPDPYVVCSIDNTKELARTKVINESVSPRWNETKQIILTTYNGNMTFGIFDFNEIRKDKEIGKASFDMKLLEENPEQENVILPLMSGTKQRGQIICDFKFFPVLAPTKLEDGTIEPPPESNTGILRYTVHQAKNLDSSKSIIGQLSPYAIMMVDNKEVHRTVIRKRNNNPSWEEFKEIIIHDRSRCTVGLKIRDDKGLSADPVLGTLDMKLNTLLDEIAKGNDTFTLGNAKSGKAKIRVDWKPVILKGGAGGSGGYVTPIGVIRVHFKSAKDLRNLERVGKSDPYGRVLLNGVEKGRTVTFNNDLDPVWDEVIYVPVHNKRESLTLEVMDAEKLGSDRSLGAYHLPIAEYIKEEGGKLLEHSEKVERSEGLLLGRKGTAKGFLNFTVSFYPCLNIADPEDEEEEKEKPRSVPITPVTPAPVTPLTPLTAKPPSETGDDVPEKKETIEEKIHLTPEELLNYNSGLLIFKILDGTFAKSDCFLEVLMDDMLFPSYVASKIKSKQMKFDEIGDAFVRELDFSKVTLRLREASKDKEHDEDDIIAKLTGQTQATLRQCLNNPTILTLRHNSGDTSKVKISLKYIPVIMKLDPSESINNMGTLRVDVLDASGLISADRNGKSDPFCEFVLNDEKIFKTKVQKKTLTPAWNEFFDTKIPSRTGANFLVKVYDWDLAGDADFLGQAQLDLATLEPFVPVQKVFKLTGKKGVAGNYGEIRLRFLFKSDYVVRSRQGSSTFSGTFAVPGKIVTGVAGVPLKGVGLAVGGIGKGASFIKRGFGGKSKNSDTLEEEAQMEAAVAAGGGVRASIGGELETVDSNNNPQIALPATAEQNMEQLPSTSRASLAPSDGRHHRRSKSGASVKSTSPSRPDTSGSGADQGLATICLVSAKGFPARDLNMRGRIRVLGPKTKEILKSKSHKASTGECTWDETCSVVCSADQQFQIYVEDDHTFIDKSLGEGLFVVDDTGSGRDTVVHIGSAQVILKTTFKPSGTSENGVGGSPKRKGFLGKKA